MSIYERIKTDLRQQIEIGQLQPGDQLPTRRSIMETYGCSWATVQRALNELRLAGWVDAERGRGTFVRHRNSDKELAVSTLLTNPETQIPFTKFYPNVALQTPNNAQQPLNILLMHPVQTVYYSLATMMDGIRLAAHHMERPVSYLDAPVSLRPNLNMHGQIVITPSLSDRPLLEAAWERGEKFVVLGSDFDEVPFPCLNADTRGWTRKAVRCLVQAGHRHIGLLGSLPGFPNYLREKQGYQDALDEAGIRSQPSWILTRSPNADQLEADLLSWFETNKDVTAVFAADYTTAVALLRATEMLGINIPEALSVLAMDELPSSDMFRVPLSTVIQPFTELGQRAVERLISMLDTDSAGGTEFLACRIEMRDSISAPKRPS